MTPGPRLPAGAGRPAGAEARGGAPPGGGDELVCFVNGARKALPPGRAEATLLQWLREERLSGTKLGCGEGGCGACTVMVSRRDPAAGGAVQHRAVNACLFPLYLAEGAHVVTVEGIGNPRDGLHPVQAALSQAHGSQCGFCTPGFVMSAYALLRELGGTRPSMEEMEDALGGNLCRCTGYRPILDAFRPFAADGEPPPGAAGGCCGGGGGAGGGCCRELPGLPAPAAPAPGGGCCGGAGAGGRCCQEEGGAGLPPAAGAPAEAAQAPPRTSEPIFPPELLRWEPRPLVVRGEVSAWHRPVDLLGLLHVKREHPGARLIAGNSEVGVEMKFKGTKCPVLVGITHVPELQVVREVPGGVEVGAACTLTRLLSVCREACAARPVFQARTLKAIAGQLRWFAGKQIKNVASIGGNVATGSPISDLNPLWMACGASFALASADSDGEVTRREVPARDFFLGYRKVAMAPDEVLVSVTIPHCSEHQIVKEYKQAHRREDDIAIVNAGMRVGFERQGGRWLVRDVNLAFGGVAAKAVNAEAAEAALRGQEWTQAALRAALAALREDVRISSDAPGGMTEFRQAVAASFLFKFYVHVSEGMSGNDGFGGTGVTARDHSAAAEFHKPPPRGLQYYDSATPGSILGEPHRHLAADLQVCGEARYTDDIPAPPGLLHAALVLSSRPHAKLLEVDPSAALEAAGVVGYFGHKDIPGDNRIGPVLHDEECFAEKEVTCVGQIIGVVVAESEAAARGAAKQVRVQYEDLPAVLTIEDAIAADSEYEGWGHAIETGDVDAAFQSGEVAHVLEGGDGVGGQEHFYLETHGCLVVPGEDDELLTYASTQALTKHQKTIASVLGLPEHKVVAKTKRIGGGFGGKESRSAAFNSAAAVPAHLLRRPVRLILDRDEDMAMSGHRHAFRSRYKVGFDAEGRVAALDLHLYCNAGNSLDLSAAIMDRALLHCDNCYKIPHMRAQGHVCRTNIPSNTAFRGFGGPQGMLLTEMMVDRIASHVGKPVEVVRELNMYREGEKTHYGQVLEDCHARRCWQEVMANSDYCTRKSGVEAYNLEHRWRKRGLAITPTKFGISFTTKFLNQAGALVHIYTDGSVLVTHGGVEMGQGLHTKVAQVAAFTLGVPLHAVHIAETSTDKVPNSSPSAASASADLYGGATLKACEELKARLAPYREKLGDDAGMKAWASAAHLDRVDLCAHGFYATPDIGGFGTERPFKYLCYGAACSEVEVDTLTGDFHIIRSDLTMDVGSSINPAIDVGQVEGAFVQGLGWMTVEELVWGDSEHKWVRPGHLQTQGPGTYKIPSVNDIPSDFRVSLLKNVKNRHAVVSSKAVGEPPFFLASSVFFAIKDALYAARAEEGLSGFFRLNSPATPEKIRMAASDRFSAPFAPHDFMPKASI